MSRVRLPYVTTDVAGVGGRIRAVPEDFCVEEIPLYPASGTGDHVMCTIEKRGLSTHEAARRLSRALGASPDRVGYAGLKDADAVTVQRVSIEHVDPDAVAALDVPGIRVLDVARHGNKLKKGHLAGNRFRVRIRDAAAGALASAREALAILSERGVPNSFGEQRFGRAGNTHRLGRALLLSDGWAFLQELIGGIAGDQGEAARAALEEKDAARAAALLEGGHARERRVLLAAARFPGRPIVAVRTLDHALVDLFRSAYQSELFNQVLCRRFDGYDRFVEGELVWLHRNGAVFALGDPAAEEERRRRVEISPSGPLFGPRSGTPTAEAAAIEESVLAANGLTRDMFRLAPGWRGARRPLRVPVSDASVGADGNDLILHFSLPPGAYATTLLREIMKPSEADSIDAVDAQ